MIRLLLVLFSVFCVATLLSQGLAVGYLWYRGHLNAEVVKDLRLVLSGQIDEVFMDVEVVQPTPPSRDDVVRTRSMRILDLTAREEELSVLKAMITQKTAELLAERTAFDGKKLQFDAQLKAVSEQMNAEAVEQTRGILTAMASPDAVENLMQLPLDEAVTLLKGMPEKTIAKILQEFAADPADPARIQRGHEILEAISRGEPNSKVVRTAAEQFASPAYPTAN
jgi:hypothetical protein